MNERCKVYEEKMQKTLKNLDGELASIRAGRANPNILNKLTVDYYGTPTPIQQVANISVPEARLIQIQPWESSLIKKVEKAILASDLGLNPNNDGKVIRLVFPDLFIFDCLQETYNLLSFLKRWKFISLKYVLNNFLQIICYPDRSKSKMILCNHVPGICYHLID